MESAWTPPAPRLAATQAVHLDPPARGSCKVRLETGLFCCSYPAEHPVERSSTASTLAASFPSDSAIYVRASPADYLSLSPIPKTCPFGNMEGAPADYRSYRQYHFFFAITKKTPPSLSSIGGFLPPPYLWVICYITCYKKCKKYYWWWREKIYRVWEINNLPEMLLGSSICDCFKHVLRCLLFCNQHLMLWNCRGFF